MSKYTTEIRFICEMASNLEASVGFNDVEKVLESSWDKVIDFDFPIFEETHRKVLIKKILRHFYTREIGFETVGLWKLNMNRKLNEIMPYYNQLYKSETLKFDPMRNFDSARWGDKIDDGYDNEHMDYKDVSDNTNRYSDTPQGGLSDVKDGKYLTTASYDDGTNWRHGDDNHKLYNKDDHRDWAQGFEGISGSELLEKYRKTFLNIDLMIIGELEDLFLQLW